MTKLSVLAMAGGLVLLAWLPLSKNRRKALLSQGVGTILFGAGLVGLVLELFPLHA